MNQRDETALDFTKLNGINPIRRITGGRAIYHDPSELTYSIAFDIDNLPIQLKNYSIKYDVSNRKIYRYIKSNIIDYIIIDGVLFLYDNEYSELKTDHRCKNSDYNVKTLTKSNSNVKTLTKQITKNSLYDIKNKENNNVKTLTINDKVLTKQEKKVLDTPDIELSSKELELKQKLKRKLNIRS